MITDIEDYFSTGCGRCDRFATPECSTRTWAEGLRQLRRICLDLALVETVKWGHPCHMSAGRNVAIVGAHRTDMRNSFFDAALMTDPEGVLERQGPNTRHPDMIRFTDDAQVVAMEPTIRSYLVLAEAFRALTPGRQRSYVINLRSAKKPETRISRIAAFRDRIIAGKGAQER